MATLGYGLCLILSVLTLIGIAARNYENINIHAIVILVLIPLVVLGYWLKSRVTTPEGAELAMCFIYLDSTAMMVITIFAMLHSFGFKVNPAIKIVGYGLAFAHALMVWASFGTGMYYASFEVTQTALGSVSKATPGPLKSVHNIYLALTMAAIIGVLIYAHFKKGTHSRRMLYNYSVVAMLLVLIYAVETLLDVDFTMLPYLYTACGIGIALSYDRMHLHDISCILSQQQKYHGNRAFIVLGMDQRFLSCNNKAYELLPFLKTQVVDEKLPAEHSAFAEMIERYLADGTDSLKVQRNERTFICEVSPIAMRKDGRKQGHLFDLRDATEEQKVLDVMSRYNETLNAEVKQKTETIIDMQRKITVGMANIVENRDGNTGGHVKRTSDVIGYLVDEAVAQGIMEGSEEFAIDIVRSAPLHDLGKISIDSSILCKPSRLTDEEYQIMKMHSTTSGEMVNILLEGVEYEHFVKAAFNIARHHHERWDGKGYPDGLAGEEIPFEARIMAIADVYDALVSKRCYKQPMSFEKAKQIMLEGMGTQFDPHLESVFLGCVDKLEDYYRKDYEKHEDEEAELVGEN